MMSTPGPHRSSIRKFVQLVGGYLSSVLGCFESVLHSEGIFCSYEPDDDLLKLVGTLEWLTCFVEFHPLYKPSQLNRWLDYKRAEIEIKEILSSLKGIIVVIDKEEMDRQLTKSYALVLKIPPLDEETNQLIEGMKDFYKHSYKWLDAVLLFEGSEENEAEGNVGYIGEKLPWYMVQRKRSLVLNKIHRFAAHVERNQHPEDRVQYFLIFDEYGKKRDECIFSVYHAGELIEDNFDRLPDGPPPTGLRIQESFVLSERSTLVDLKWDYDDLRYQFVVEHRLKQNTDKTWTRLMTKPGETQATIFFELGLFTEIRVAAITCIGCGRYSDVLNALFLFGGSFMNWMDFD